MELKFNGLEGKMSDISANQVDKARFDAMQLQVASLSEGYQELEKRLQPLEDHDNIGMWVFRIIAGVSTALLISYLTGLLH